jgi:hypothetical protein
VRRRQGRWHRVVRRPILWPVTIRHPSHYLRARFSRTRMLTLTGEPSKPKTSRNRR